MSEPYEKVMEEYQHDSISRRGAKEIASLRAEVSRLTAELESTQKERNAFQDQCIRLKIEASLLRAQEPVGSFRPNDYHGWQQVADEFANDADVTKLYARPIPAAQAVPADYDLANRALFAWGCTGKNMMIAEVLQNGDALASALRTIIPGAQLMKPLDADIAKIVADNAESLYMSSPPAAPDGDALLFAEEAKRGGS